MAETKRILIQQARIFDPAQQKNGDICDLYVSDGKISAAFDNPQQVIQANGRAVLAGGIDPYCLLAAPGQSIAHMVADFPSLDEIGRMYARMGYVHLHHPFTTLLTASLARRALAFIPIMDTSTGVVIDLRDLGRCIKTGKKEEFSLLARALLHLTGARRLFLPIPQLRHKQRHYIQKNLSAKKVLGFLSELDDPDLLPVTLWAVPELFKNEIPGAERFHITGLGMALDSENALEHAAKFLSDGGSADLGLSAGSEQLMAVPFREALPKVHLSMDAGLLSPLHFFIKSLPFEHSLTRAGWSLFKDADPSWRLSLSASGPAGGQYGHMPALAAWLTRRETRPEGLKPLFDPDSLTLYDLARYTRHEPAQYLGLPDSGHLKIGARANIAIYDISRDTRPEHYQAALSDCWCLVKDGIMVREAGTFTENIPRGHLYHREVEVDIPALAQTDLLQNPSLRFEQLSRHRQTVL